MGFLAASSTTSSIMGGLQNIPKCFCQFTWRAAAPLQNKVETLNLRFGSRYTAPILIVPSSNNFSTSHAFLVTRSGSGPGNGADPSPLFRTQPRSRSIGDKEKADRRGDDPGSSRKADIKGAKKVKAASSSRSTTTFYDTLRVYVKAGNGGRGLPSKGGIGGKGGDIIAIGHKEMSLKTINDLYPTRRFAALQGSDSKLFCLNGEPGKTIVLPVPLGVTIVSEMGQPLGEINDHGEKLVIAKGGLGGSPSNGFFLEQGQKHNVTLDLKLIADVGFVGFPNAGKSTLLKALSRASPKIASYPFTTIRPNVGIIEYPDFRRISLADLPGLIEGAHVNIGMGHKFLKHVERTKVLLFVVDIHGFQLGPEYPKRSALETIVLLNKELELYKEELTEKPAILALNKMDLPGSFDIIYKIRDTLSDQRAYEKFLGTLPQEFWPDNVILFDNIIPISAAKDVTSVQQLQKKLRKVLDVNELLGNDNALMTTSTEN